MQLTSTTTLSSGNRQSVVKITRTNNDTYYDDLRQSNMTVTFSNIYPGQAAKTIIVSQKSVVFPGSKVPANRIDGNAVYYVAPVEQCGDYVSYNDIPRYPCPSPWKIPSSTDFKKMIKREDFDISNTTMIPWSGTLGAQIKAAYPGDRNIWTTDEKPLVFRVRTKEGYGFYAWLREGPGALRCVKDDQ
ncbi:hypothetical protein [Parabacteroides faecis]|uniref:hypothetical protein n=1 Tax=Parabacteroides faecis TaxID=1217282 RepID=UPI0035213A97